LHAYLSAADCRVLMALLFVGGVMNVLWIGLLALFILLEKVTPWARIANLAGVVFVAAGAWFLSPGIF
jgi:predicted metal-binding membrane protein